MRNRAVATPEAHQVTKFELFFDLVFVFSMTRVVSFMDHSSEPTTLIEGLLLLFLLWWAWCAFAWLGNQVRADRGYVQVGMTFAMTGLFVAGLVIPEAWGPGAGSIDGPMILAIVFTCVRLTYIVLFLSATKGDSGLRTQIAIDVIPQTVSGVLLVTGAAVGGGRQTILWAIAFVADFAGGPIASRYRGWRLRSPGHFAERHSLVLIIALGESLVSAGTGAGFSVTRWPVLVAATLGFALAAVMWWLYFGGLAVAAERALTHAAPSRRAAMARDAYTLAHFPLVVGVVYVALGIRLLLTGMVTSGGYLLGPELSWSAAGALCGGLAVYLSGLDLVRWITLRSWQPRGVLVIGGVLTMLPVIHGQPALLALGVVVAAMLAIAGGTQVTSVRTRVDRASTLRRLTGSTAERPTPSRRV